MEILSSNYYQRLLRPWKWGDSHQNFMSTLITSWDMSKIRFSRLPRRPFILKLETIYTYHNILLTALFVLFLLLVVIIDVHMWTNSLQISSFHHNWITNMPKIDFLTSAILYFSKMAAEMRKFWVLNITNGLCDHENGGIATNILCLPWLWAEIWAKSDFQDYYGGHFEKSLKWP